MADETIIEPAPEPSEAQKRITQLSEKVRLTAEERDEQKRLLSEESAKRATVEKERDFYQGFSDVLSQNPAAKDFKEDILTKVKGGYTVEDATYAVLGKAGKLGATPTAEPQNPAGGSASTAMKSAEKPVSEMSQTERRSQLEKELSWT